MNRRQRSVLLIGILFVAVTALYPPWVFVDEYRVLMGPAISERLAGYHFYFAPPSPTLPPECAATLARKARERPPWPFRTSDDPRDVCELIASVTRIDTRRLTVEWAAIALVVAGLLLLLQSKPTQARASETARSPSAGLGSAETLKTSPPESGATRGPIESCQNANRQDLDGTAANPRPRAEARTKGAGLLAWPHWALKVLDDNLSEGFFESQEDELKSLGLFDRLDHPLDPLTFLSPHHPELPPWLPQKVQGRPLSPSERLAWFDELLRYYLDSPLTWPPNVESSLKTRMLLRSLYLMYQGRITGTLPPPSFIPAKPSKPGR